MKNLSFIDDKEKINDMLKLSKEEFLESYSYITNEEYNRTYEELCIDKLNHLSCMYDFHELEQKLDYDELIELNNEVSNYIYDEGENSESYRKEHSDNKFDVENFLDWYEGVKTTEDFISDYRDIGKEVEL